VSGLYDLTRSTRSYCRIMPGRGFGVRAGDEEGATATWSVAACICRGVRRRNTIKYCLRARAGQPGHAQSNALSSRAAPCQAAKARKSAPGRIVAEKT